VPSCLLLAGEKGDFDHPRGYSKRRPEKEVVAALLSGNYFLAV